MRTSNARRWVKSEPCPASKQGTGRIQPEAEDRRQTGETLAPLSAMADDITEDTSVRVAPHFIKHDTLEEYVEVTPGDSLPPPVPLDSVLPPPAEPAREPADARPDDAASDSALSRYFREMALHPVMGPEDEVRAAKAVEGEEITYWNTILSNPQAAAYAFDVIDDEVERCAERDEIDLRPLAELRKLAKSYRSQRGKWVEDQERRWVSLCTRLARAIRLPDSDRLWVARCAQLARDLVEPCENALEASNESVLPPTRAYVRYLERIQEAYERQLRVKSVFVKANLRLVVSIARRYNRGRMPLIDLIQEGNIGLMKAVERFDHRRGYRFSTYASWWIRHAISRALADKGRAVRIPVHMLDTHNRVARATQAVIARTGRDPTLDELERETGIPRDKLDKVKDFYAETPFSLDRPVGDEDGRRFIDFLQEDDPTSPYDHLANQKWADEVRRLLTTLTPIESRIIRWRFGLDDENELTLKEIGDKYNLSRERIRQLQEQALCKIRKQMREY
jgi:RNA polymerase primary sigma factor